MLHMDVFRQRIFDEYEMEVIITQPSITYLAEYINSPEKFKVNNPIDIEKPDLIK
jgi:translation elongation factor EF-4